MSRDYDAVQELKEFIGTYESNTFSAEGTNLRSSEVDAITAEIIKRAMEHLDGVTIDSILYDIREGNL